MADAAVLELTEADKALIASGDAAAVVAALRQASDEKEVSGVRRALRVLCEVCAQGKDRTAAVAKADAAEAILSCLRGPLFAQHAVVRQAAAALGHLAAGAEEGRATCVEAGAISVALGAMAQHGGRATVQQLLARFLQVVMQGSPSAQKEVAEANGVQRLTQLVGVQDSPETTAEALAALAVVSDPAVMLQIVSDPATRSAATAALRRRWTGRGTMEKVAPAAARLLLNIAGVASARSAFETDSLQALVQVVQDPESPRAAALCAARALALLVGESEVRARLHEAGAAAPVWRSAEAGAHGTEAAAACLETLGEMLSIPAVHAVASPALIATRVLQLLAAADAHGVASCLAALAVLARQHAAHDAVVARDELTRALSDAYDAHKADAGVAAALVGCVGALIGRPGEARRRLGNFGWVERVLELARLHKAVPGVVRGCLTAAAFMCADGSDHQGSVIVHGGLTLVADRLSATADPSDLSEPAADLVAALDSEASRQAVAEIGLMRLLFQKLQQPVHSVVHAACARAVATQVTWPGAGGKANAAAAAGVQGASTLFRVGKEGAGRELRLAVIGALTGLSSYASSLPQVCELPVGEAASWVVGGDDDEPTAAALRALARLLLNAATATPQDEPEVPCRPVVLTATRPLDAFGTHAALVHADPELASLTASAARAVAAVEPKAAATAEAASGLVAALEGSSSCETAVARTVAEAVREAVEVSSTEGHEFFVSAHGLKAVLQRLPNAPEAEASQLLRLCASLSSIPPAAVVQALEAGCGAALTERLGLDEMELQSLAAAAQGQGRFGRSQDAWVAAGRVAFASSAYREELSAKGLDQLTASLGLHLKEPDPSLVFCLGSLLLSRDVREHVEREAPQLVPALLAHTPHPDHDAAAHTPMSASVAWLAACLLEGPTEWTGSVPLSHMIALLRASRDCDPPFRGAVWGERMHEQAARAIGVYESRVLAQEGEKKESSKREAEVLETVDPHLRRRLDAEGEALAAEEEEMRRQAAAADLLASRTGYQFTPEEAAALQRADALQFFLQQLRLVRFDGAKVGRCFACIHQALTDAREKGNADAIAAVWTDDAVQLLCGAFAEQVHDPSVFHSGCMCLCALVEGAEGGREICETIVTNTLDAAVKNAPAVHHASQAGAAVGELLQALLPVWEAPVCASGILGVTASLLRAHQSDDVVVRSIAVGLSKLPRTPLSVGAARAADLPRYLLVCLPGREDEELELVLLQATRSCTRVVAGAPPLHALCAGPQGVQNLADLLRARWGHAVDVQREAAALLADVAVAEGGWRELLAAQAQNFVRVAFGQDESDGGGVTDVPTLAHLTVVLAALLPHSAELRRAGLGEDDVAAAVLKQLHAARGFDSDSETACVVAAELLAALPAGREALAARDGVAAVCAVGRRRDPPASRDALWAVLAVLRAVAAGEVLRSKVASEGTSVVLAALASCPVEDRGMAMLAAATLTAMCDGCTEAQVAVAAEGSAKVLPRALMRWEGDAAVLSALSTVVSRLDAPSAKVQCLPLVRPLCAAAQRQQTALSRAEGGEELDAAASAASAALGAVENLSRGCGANQDAAAAAGVEVVCAVLQESAKVARRPAPGSAAGVTVRELLRCGLGLASVLAFAELPPSELARLASAFAFAASAALSMPPPQPSDALRCAVVFAGAGLESARQLAGHAELLQIAGAAARENSELGSQFADLVRVLATEADLGDSVGRAALPSLASILEAGRPDAGRVLAALQLLIRGAGARERLLHTSADTPICVTLARAASDAAGKGRQEVLQLAASCLEELGPAGAPPSAGHSEATGVLCLAAKVHAGSRGIVAVLCGPLARWAREDGSTRHAVRTAGLLGQVRDDLLADAAKVEAELLLLLGAELFYDDGDADSVSEGLGGREAFLFGERSGGLDALLDAIPLDYDPQSRALQALGWCLAMAVMHGDESVVDRVVARRGATAIAVGAQSPALLPADRRLCGEAVERIRTEEASRTSEAGLSLEEVRAAMRKADRAHRSAEKALQEQSLELARTKQELSEARAESARVSARLQDQQKLIADERTRGQLEMEGALAELQAKHRHDLQSTEHSVLQRVKESSRYIELEREVRCLKDDLEAAVQERANLRAAHAAEASAMAELQEQELRNFESRYREREQLTSRQRQWELESLAAERKALAESERRGRENAEAESRDLQRTAQEARARAEAVRERAEELARENASLAREAAERSEELRLSTEEHSRREKEWQERMESAVGGERSRAARKEEELRVIHDHQQREAKAQSERDLEDQLRRLGFAERRASAEQDEMHARKAVKIEQRDERSHLMERKNELLTSFLQQCRHSEMLLAEAKARRPEVLRTRRAARAARELWEQARMGEVDYCANAALESHLQSGSESAIQKVVDEEAVRRAELERERKEAKRAIRTERAVQLRDALNVPISKLRDELGGEYAAWATEREVGWRQHAAVSERAYKQQAQELKELTEAQRRRLLQLTDESNKLRAKLSELSERPSAAPEPEPQPQSPAPEALAALEERASSAEQRAINIDSQRAAAELRSSGLEQQVAALELLRQQDLAEAREALTTASRESARAREADREADSARAELRASKSKFRTVQIQALEASEQNTRKARENAALDGLTNALELVSFARSVAEAGAASALARVYGAGDLQAQALEARMHAALLANGEEAEDLSRTDAVLALGGLGMNACAVAGFRALREDVSEKDELRLLDALATMGLAAADAPALGAAFGEAADMMGEGLWRLVSELTAMVTRSRQQLVEARGDYTARLAQALQENDEQREQLDALQRSVAGQAPQDTEARVRVMDLERLLAAQHRASEQIANSLMQQHERESAVLREQLREQEEVSDRLRTGGDPDVIHPQHAERMRILSARARDMEEEVQKQLRTGALLKDKLREAEDAKTRAQEAANRSSEQTTRAEQQLEVVSAALRKAEQEVESVRATARQALEDREQKALEEHSVVERELARVEASWEEQQKKLAAVQYRLRRREEMREQINQEEDELREQGLEVCVSCISQLKERLYETEGALLDAKEDGERMRREKEAALGQMERAVEKEGAAMAKYLRVLAAKDGVLQRGKELDRRAWEVSTLDKEVERREALVLRREIELHRATATGSAMARPASLPRLPVKWSTERLEAADKAVAMTRQELYTHGNPRPLPTALPGLPPPEGVGASKSLLHHPLRPGKGSREGNAVMRNTV
eukprot:Hpha_TRINITY_DN14583_c0_g1::TRINITY_DN14583_c0_g1_i1::g.47138::m.47138